MNTYKQDYFPKSLWPSAIGLIFLAFSCSALPNGNTDTDLQPIEEGIQFTVKETHDHGEKINNPVDPFVQLKMKTQDIYQCMNFQIVSELEQGPFGLRINIEGVNEPGVCLTALGPATKTFPLDLSSGEYSLAFTYQGETYPFHLTISDTSLQVTADDTSFVKPEIQTFWRYPENSFSYLCDSTPETRWMCEDFEQMLTDSLDISSFSFPDEGTIPYPTVGEQYDIASYYNYPEESVFLKAGEMLEAYSDSVVSQEEGAYLSVINWKNKGFRSWTDVGE